MEKLIQVELGRLMLTAMQYASALEEAKTLIVKLRAEIADLRGNGPENPAPELPLGDVKAAGANGHAGAH